MIDPSILCPPTQTRAQRNNRVLAPDDVAHKNQSQFRIIERSFKRRRISPELWATVIDLQHPETNYKDKNLNEILLPRPRSSLFGSHEEETIKAYTFHAHPGLIVIPNAFSAPAQREVVKSCLQEWVKRPNVYNLDTHYLIGKESLWTLHENDWKCRKASPDSFTDTVLKRRDGERQGYEESYSDEESQKLTFDPPTTAVTNLVPLTVSEAVRKWRWSSLGLQYNWFKKEYHMDRNAPVPALLQEICHSVVESVQEISGFDAKNYRPEAGIINFYQTSGDSLTAHQDRSELNTEAPLVSLSFGNACVFLFGAETREELAPTPILLRSGDVVVMSGQSRRCFHGVPRVLEGTLPQHLKSGKDISPAGAIDDGDSRDESWDVFAEFLETTRININMRQVF